MAQMRKQRTITYWGERMRLPVDCEDEDVQDVFTRGQCHSFARAVHRLTGWPLYVLTSGDYDGPVSYRGEHVVCQAPSGEFVDVYGFWDMGERWDWLPEAVPVSEWTVRAINRYSGGWDAQNVRAALPFARQLLRTNSRY